MAGDRKPGFFTMVAGTMAALKLKERWDDYRAVSTEDGHGEVALGTSRSAALPRYTDADGDAEAQEGLIETPLLTRQSHKRTKRGCCVCCGLDCTLFWKAFGIVLLVTLVWNAIKLVRWATSEAPTGLENMPEYEKSLTCTAHEATHLYNGTVLAHELPLGSGRFDHALDIRGEAVGTLLITSAPASATTITLTLSLRASSEELNKLVDVRLPIADEEDGTSTDSRFILTTPRGLAKDDCMRFDATLALPRNLKKLHIATHALTHIKVADGAEIDIDDLFVTMYAMNTDNLLLTHGGVRAQRLALETTRGWIVGDVNILEKTTVTTQRGDGVINIKATPRVTEENLDVPAILRTLSGYGRTDVEFAKAMPHRPIAALHQVQDRGDMYLRYGRAGFNGPVELHASSYTAKNLQGAASGVNATDNAARWAGDRAGKDDMEVRTEGWVGLYF